MPNGYHGKILHVDLTSGRIEVEQPDEAFYRRYMGGSALGASYLLSLAPRGVDPFAPENPLILALSVLTGAPFSGQSRMTAVARSPLTGAVGDSQSGGYFPAELKFAGFDAVVLRGRAESPVYLWIHDGAAELRPAGHLWGHVTGEAEAALRAELGDAKIEVLQIGPAGERAVRFAALMSMSNRANGRTGMGAVMGSKNLKAVAVRGRAKPSLADRAAVIQLARWGAEHFDESAIHDLGVYGTSQATRGQNAAGGLVTRNWDSGVFDGWEALDGRTMAQSILKDRDTCYACTVRCKRVVEVTEGPYRADPLYGGPEFETLATFGAYCGISDLKALAHVSQLCNMYGMDTISCGATVAWAIDCFEHGLLSRDEADGLELHFGNVEAMVRLTEKIARREGIGDLLAEGSTRAAARLGRGSEELVVAVKGQEIPAHMPQVKRSLALVYAVNPFGPDHQSSEHDPAWKPYAERMAEIGITDPPEPAKALTEAKVRFALRTQFAYSCLDSLDICQFVFGPAWHLYAMPQLAEVVCAVTGWPVDVEELMRLGERRLNLLRAYNAREGFDRSADVLPKKLAKALTGGKSDGLLVTPEEVEAAKDAYYAHAGWEVSTGTPTRGTLARLELGWVADLLDKDSGVNLGGPHTGD